MMMLSKIVKSVLGLSLIVTSTISFAATFNFHIINSSDSIVNPITITNWYTYAGSNNSSPACAPKKEQFTSDIKVRKKQEAIFSYDPEYPAECYNGNSPDSTGRGVWVAMYIITVDGKSISGTCQFPGPGMDNTTYDPNANTNAGTVKVTEMSDRFLCEFPIGVQK